VTETHPRLCPCGDRIGYTCPGGEVPYAHLLIVAPLPGMPPEYPMQWVKRVPLSFFDKYERERGHYVKGGQEDPALWSYDQMAADAVARLVSVSQMNLPEDP
jgi:hypothetical protein